MIDRQKVEWILEDFREEGSTQTLEDTLDRIEKAIVIDLDDPTTENAVADAIDRLHPGEWLPLSRRYPWRFPEAGRCGHRTDYMPPGLTCALHAGHTGQHESPWHGGVAYWDGSEETTG